MCQQHVLSNVSILERFFSWYRKQTLPVQVFSAILLFATLFVLGVFTAGIVPGILLVVVLIDHLLRGE